ncbi:RES domain-containing protein [Microlunatus elymi]|uniref:RES domain-containing protein n=1 Tax=Microlunatus elymi TaxID=2596828 RepID=A0A516PZ83_9ACTN|nr:RES family NAD+ phosphorylase [Microlunatus elymi]QDP96486.1 RES domain-containing protein [Microlunatus elymi]
MARADLAQQLPPARTALNGLPTGTVSRKRGWLREHQFRSGADGGCWYFATVPPDPTLPSGRFDLPTPHGTCYFADTQRAAAMERVGVWTTKHKPVPQDFVDGRAISTVDPGALPERAVNLGSPRATGFGVTGELFTMSDYQVPQAWALAVYGLGHAGILYPPRFTPGGRALAVFGRAGVPATPIAVVRQLPLADVLHRNHIRIARIPHSTSLTMVNPP